MRPAVRVGLVVLGTAMAVYGAASLTGGWLGTPPWWDERPETYQELSDRLGFPDEPRPNVWMLPDPPLRTLRQPGGEGIASGGVAAGLALVAVGVWPRRRAGVTS